MRHMNISRWVVALAIAATGLFSPSRGDAATISLEAFLDSGQEAYGGSDPAPNGATGQATWVLDTVTKTFDYSLTVTGVFVRDFIDGPPVPELEPFLDPAGPNYTPVHIHNAPIGANGPIVIEPGAPTAEMLVGGLIPSSPPHPFRPNPFAGFASGGITPVVATPTGFTIDIMGAAIPNGALSTPDGGPAVGPLVHGLDADGILAEALAGRLFTNVHASFFEGVVRKGQNLPSSLIRGQLQVVQSQGGHPIPEPSTMLLFGTGMLGLIGYMWRRKRSTV